ncbi:MAG TPA: BlaI/MecI/CopY family transcriptional regulator [Steroidobacteraceae bacterium]|jgi:predicted transcriptional regulator|nr:BlaI/MecI/CopY family transcriptional regulator [Steroidobacteraceae bacterium]
MTQPHLSRRERQIMDIVYRLGSATAAEIRAQLPDPPSYSAIRALLRILVEKQHLQHREDGPRYVYSPTVSRRKARAGALTQLVDTFFDGSASQAVSALLGSSRGKLSEAELDELSALIETARNKGR